MEVAMEDVLCWRRLYLWRHRRHLLPLTSATFVSLFIVYILLSCAASIFSAINSIILTFMAVLKTHTLYDMKVASYMHRHDTP